MTSKSGMYDRENPSPVENMPELKRRERKRKEGKANEIKGTEKK